MSPYSFKNGWDMSKIVMNLTAADFRWGALTARDEIRKRTLNGNDINGKPFVPYSQATVDRRAAIGKKTDIVNLEDTNAMLGSLTIDANKEGGSVGLSNANAAEYGLNHQTGSGVPKREWFGLSDSGLQDLSEKLCNKIIERNEKKGTK